MSLALLQKFKDKAKHKRSNFTGQHENVEVWQRNEWIIIIVKPI